MGLWSTIKGWLNIGGVKVMLQSVPTQVSRSGNELNGQLQLSSKSEKHVLKIEYKLVEEEVSGRGDDKETKEQLLGRSTMSDSFDIKADENKTLDFSISYAVPERLADKGGVMGSVGKLGAFASGQKLKYFVVAECDVKGTPLDPSDRVEVTIVD